MRTQDCVLNEEEFSKSQIAKGRGRKEFSIQRKESMQRHRGGRASGLFLEMKVRRPKLGGRLAQAGAGEMGWG